MELINYICAKVVTLRAMRDDEKGVTALEYGLVAAFVAIALITALTTLRGSLTTFLNSVGTAVAGITVSATP